MKESSTNSTSELPFARGPRVWRLRLFHQGKERVRVLKRGESLVLGSGDGADLCLDDPSVSGSHCRLTAGTQGLHLVDLKSKNGTFVGAARVEDGILVGPSAGFTIGRTSVEAEDRFRPHARGDLGLIGQSDAIARVRDSIMRFARLKAPVLISGESGTGKDLVASALHAESGRAGEYVPLNVAAMPDSLLDAELFGHHKGAFTGAVAQRAGLFEQAEGGTLFLDEIADMSPGGQAKLLRVVEDGRVRALGSEKDKRVDVRLVSATCAALAERINAERFRHDLYHRLSTLVIEIPPLRQRTADIPLLAESYLERISGELGAKRLLPATSDLLRRAPWPGNVRQLFGVLYRAAALTPDDALCPGHLHLQPNSARSKPRLLPQRAHELLDIHGGSVSAAARAAGVPRTTFRSVIERHPSAVSPGTKSR